MSEPILLRMHRRHVEAVEEAWQAAHHEAMMAGDVDRMLGSCPALAEGLRQSWQSTFEKIRDGQIDNLNQTRQDLESAFAATLRTLQHLRDWGRDLAQRGHELRSLPAVTQALAETETLHEQVFAHWPVFTQRDLGEAALEHARGECLDLDDAFAQIAGVDKDTWLRRVEEHKRATRS